MPNQAYLTMPGGEVLAYSATANGTTTTTVPLHNIVGSTIGLVNASRAIATSFTYEPFGTPTSSGSATTFPYLFAGMEYDAGTRLYHTPARYYSPRLQRFLSEDPLQYGGGDLNLFRYVGNDPVDHTDRLGLDGFAFLYGFAGALPVSANIGFNDDSNDQGEGVGTVSEYINRQNDAKNAQDFANSVVNAENSGTPIGFVMPVGQPAKQRYYRTRPARTARSRYRCHRRDDSEK